MATDIANENQIQVLPAELRPCVDHLVIDDGVPVDSIISEKQMRLLTEPLYATWADPKQPRPFVAMANVGLFYGTNLPPLVPDVLLSMDVSLPADMRLKESQSYFSWVYGKPPEVVIEVVSNREGGEDTTKLAAYARIGIGYYMIFDPECRLTKEVLRGFSLSGQKYRRMEEPLWFEEVGLGLRLWQGQFENWDRTWLRWIDAKGVPIPTGRERADDERQRADRLTEQLRRLGLEPQG